MKTETELLDEFIRIRYKSEELLHDDVYFRKLVLESIGFNSYVASYRLGVAIEPINSRIQKYFDIIIKYIKSWIR